MKFYNILKNYLSNKRNQLIKISLFVAISFSIICNFTNILNLILNAKIVKNYHQLSKNSSNQQIPYLQNLTEDIKDSKEKVAITFRLQNIYRISLNCYWTKFMGLHQKILYDYKYRKSIKFCRHPKDSAEVLVDTTSEMIIKMQNEIKKKDIRVIDNHFVDFFPTNKLIEGGWFPGYKGRNRSFFFSDSNTKCIPMERIAILVPYRDREDNLNSFLAYMHFYLQKQEKAYKIFVIEQSNENKVFNKGRLYNMGFKYIIENEKEWEFNCIILHDVDLLPVNFSLDYTCSNMPKHMSTNVIRLVDNSKLAHYHFLTGGVLALRPEQYKIINGYSNEYWVVMNKFHLFTFSKR